MCCVFQRLISLADDTLIDVGPLCSVVISVDIKGNKTSYTYEPWIL